MAFRDVNGWIRLVARVLATGELPLAVTDDTPTPTPAERVSLALHVVKPDGPLPRRVPGRNPAAPNRGAASPRVDVSSA
jgi:hypothetical protein